MKIIKKVKSKLFILFALILFVPFLAFGQDAVTEPKGFNELVAEIFEPLLVVIMMVTSFLSAKIPALKNVNKAVIALVVFVLIGVINIAFFGGNVKETFVAALMAVLTYNGFGKKILTEPMVKPI